VRPVRQTMLFFGEAFLHYLKGRNGAASGAANGAANGVANEAMTAIRNKKVT